MKKFRVFPLLLILLVLLAAVSPVCAEGETAQDATEPTTAEPAASEPAAANFTVNAKAALLLDLNTGRTLYEQNADAKIYPASLTKIMTCLLALENGNLSDVLTVDEAAFADLDSDSSSAGLLVGEQMSLENILYCMMIVSANEACNVVAEYISGSVEEFVKLMNERAYELGCTGTHFSNAHGLHSEEHYTTARDLAIITQAALKSTTFRQITNTAEYTVPATNLSAERVLDTTNKLIDKTSSNLFYYSKASGIKTGYTTPAGRCVISTAQDEAVSLLAVVCGAETVVLDDGNLEMESFPECIRLFKYGFDSFTYVTALSPLYPLTQVAVSNSAGSEAVALAPEKELKLLLPNGYDPEKLVKNIQLDAETVDAPIAAGTKLGVVSVSYDGEVLGEIALTAIADVAKSEISAVATNTSTYIQKNWWKWVVVLIIILVILFIILLLLLEVRRRKSRVIRLEQRRKSLEKQRRDREGRDL